MATESESILTQINESIFFKEFTFNQTHFPTEDGDVELADNFILLDDIVFVTQTKERSKERPDTPTNVDRWFKDRVLNKAKKQIKESLMYLEKYPEVSIKNSRGHIIMIPKIDRSQIKSIIIYLPNSENLALKHRRQKFYQSQDVGNIHLLHLEDYLNICKILVTPAEVNAYLTFRELMMDRHILELNNFSEQYLLSHFLYNPDDLKIDERYIELLSRFKNEEDVFDVSDILAKFIDRIYVEENKVPERYYPIIQEIAKLSRHELTEFKIRFKWMVDCINEGKTFAPLPKRFGTPRTNCGFVFLPFNETDRASWEPLLMYNTTLFKYKHKYKKCVGVTCYKTNQYFDIQWCYISQLHEHDDFLENAIKEESDQYGKGENVARHYEFDGDGSI